MSEYRIAVRFPSELPPGTHVTSMRDASSWIHRDWFRWESLDNPGTYKPWREILYDHAPLTWGTKTIELNLPEEPPLGWFFCDDLGFQWERIFHERHGDCWINRDESYPMFSKWRDIMFNPSLGGSVHQELHMHGPFNPCDRAA